MQSTPVIVILDIGKTNKKILVFDTDYNIISEESIHLKETVDEDGDACEDIQLLTSWIRDSFTRMLALPRLAVRAVNISAYGASLVHLGANGTPVAPLYNYLKPLPAEIGMLFRDTYPGVPTSTASPDLGNLNSGIVLYMLKKAKPAVFSQITSSLHLPQYASYVLTGDKSSDLTSLGCHTFLWDFATSDYHKWVDAEGIRPLMAGLKRSNAVVEIKRDKKIIYSGIGLHDSSAALIPYLISNPEPFCLISTGTWCITLNPFNYEPLTETELALDCLCYLSFLGQPVKASRLFSGHFHDQQVQAIASHFHKGEDFFKTLSFEGIRETKGLQPLRDTGIPFEVFPVDSFSSAESAYLHLIEELVARQVRSTKLVLGSVVKKLFVDGGFSMNPIFMTLLSEALPDYTISAASVGQASALGAALAIHEAWNERPVRKDLLLLKKYRVNS